MKSYIFVITTLVSLVNVINFVNADSDVYLNTYGECNSVPSTEEEYTSFCNTIFSSEKCQNYYNNPDKAIGAGFDDIDIATVQYHYEKAKVVCQTDDTKTKCPIGQYFIDISSDSSVVENDYILKSCRSKTCIDATSSYIAAKEKYYNLKYPDKIESFSKKFKSQNELLKCTDADAIAKVSDATSNTNKATNDSKSNTSGTSAKKGDTNNGAEASTDSSSDANGNIANDTNADSNANDGTTSNNKKIEADQTNFGESISLDKKIALLVGFILINILFL